MPFGGWVNDALEAMDFIRNTSLTNFKSKVHPLVPEVSFMLED